MAINGYFASGARNSSSRPSHISLLSANSVSHSAALSIQICLISPARSFPDSYSLATLDNSESSAYILDTEWIRTTNPVFASANAFSIPLDKFRAVQDTYGNNSCGMLIFVLRDHYEQSKIIRWIPALIASCTCSKLVTCISSLIAGGRISVSLFIIFVMLQLS